MNEQRRAPEHWMGDTAQGLLLEELARTRGRRQRARTRLWVGGVLRLAGVGPGGGGAGFRVVVAVEAGVAGTGWGLEGPGNAAVHGGGGYRRSADRRRTAHLSGARSGRHGAVAHVAATPVTAITCVSPA